MIFSIFDTEAKRQPVITSHSNLISMASYTPHEDPFAQPGGHNPPPPPSSEDLPQAQSAMVMGIISIVTAFFCGGIVGLILGIISLSQVKKNQAMLDAEPNRWTSRSIDNLKTGRITAIIGVIIGSLYTLVMLFYFLFIFVYLGAIAGELSDLPMDDF